MSQPGSIEALEGLFALPAHEPVQYVGGLWFVSPRDRRMLYESALLGRHKPDITDPAGLIDLIRASLEADLDCKIPAGRIAAASVVGFPEEGVICYGAGDPPDMQRLASLIVVDSLTEAEAVPTDGLRRVGGIALGYEMSCLMLPDADGVPRRRLAVHLPRTLDETASSIATHVVLAAPETAGGPMYAALHHHLPTDSWLEQLVRATDL